MLTGHLDTVGVEGMPDPFTPTVEADRLSGRGSSDMKGGVAAMVVAAEELARRGAPGRVVLALVADEEDASIGAEAVLAALPGLGVHPDVAVVGEPTWLADHREPARLRPGRGRPSPAGPPTRRSPSSGSTPSPTSAGSSSPSSSATPSSARAVPR